MLRELPHAQVRFSTRFTGMKQDADGVTASAETPGGVETLRGAWLIGADGGRSSVRKAAGIAFEGFTWPERYLVVSTPRDLSQYGYASNTYIADPQEWLAIFHMPDTGPPGLWRMAAPVRPEQGEGEVLSDAYAQGLIRRFFPVKDDSPIPYKGIYSVHQRVAAQFRAGRVLLAGDAAHVNNPLGGFGLNSGIHDAVNLAEKLSQVMRGAADESLMDLYVRQRRVTNLEYVQSISIKNKQAMEEKDPSAKQKWIDGQRAIAADPAQAREFLLNSSMINSIRRANAVQ
jgi:3-(3-hydroxy-phenyl)propionate hydroxylase